MSTLKTHPRSASIIDELDEGEQLHREHSRIVARLRRIERQHMARLPPCGNADAQFLSDSTTTFEPSPPATHSRNGNYRGRRPATAPSRNRTTSSDHADGVRPKAPQGERSRPRSNRPASSSFYLEGRRMARKMVEEREKVVRRELYESTRAEYGREQDKIRDANILDVWQRGHTVEWRTFKERMAHASLRNRAMRVGLQMRRAQVDELTVAQAIGPATRRLRSITRVLENASARKDEPSLSLSSCLLSSLPVQLVSLTHLTSINVSGNSLTSLSIPSNLAELHPSRGLPELVNLRIMDVSSNCLKSLPVCELPHLEVLQAAHNWLTSLPEDVSALTALHLLDVEDNKLSAIPPGLAGCTALVDLILVNNRLSKLPKTIGKLTNLRTLELDVNFLRTLPPQIGALTALARLSVSRNGLTELPPSIGRLALLRQLDVHDNQLAFLPRTIGDLTDLVMLNISSNRLQTVPASIGSLKSLCNLCLEPNQNLAFVPHQLVALAWHSDVMITPDGIKGQSLRRWLTRRCGASFDIPRHQQKPVDLPVIPGALV